MADFTIRGIIEGVRYTDKSAIVTVSELRLGYKNNDGTYVDNEIITFKVFFKGYFKQYISKHFDSGMLVGIKGVMIPYTKDIDGNIGDAFTLYGQTIDKIGYPKSTFKAERKMVKDSQIHGTGTPDLEGYNAQDW